MMIIMLKAVQVNKRPHALIAMMNIMMMIITIMMNTVHVVYIAYKSITPERMVLWRTVKSLLNRLDKGYLLMTTNFGTVITVLAQMAKICQGSNLVLWKT